MSGQPYRYAKDPQEFRQRYMNSLSTQVDVDDMNLQANKVYKATGQLPAISQMPETRTTAEIHADEQKIRTGLMKNLEPIADPVFASSIVEHIYKSPLNSNNKLLMFVAQRAPEIVSNLKKIYGMKIKGDINDAVVIVQVFEDMYNKSKQSLASVESYFNRADGRAGAPGGPVGFAQEDFDALITALRELRRKIDIIPTNRLPAATRAIYTDAVEFLITRIAGVINAIITNAEFQTLNGWVEEIVQAIPNSDIYMNHWRELLAVYKEELPRVDTLKSLLMQLEKTVENANPQEFLNTYSSFIGYLPDEPTIERMIALYQYLVDEHQDLANQGVLAGGPVLGARTPGVPGVQGNGIKRGRGRPKGSGISVPFKDKVDTSRGIKAEPRYIAFGRYLINTKKLKDNIMAIKRPSGGNIIEFPSTKISNNLSEVIKKIVGGKIPTFNELSALSDEEKDYLYRVTNKSEIEDKFSIPAPSKDKLEKELHNFEVMKGEIMAGNDSKELIKNFKVLILKLSKSGSLPKKDVHDILQELLEMGY